MIEGNAVFERARSPADKSRRDGWIEQIAESEKDWSRLVQIMEREVSILEGDEKFDQLVATTLTQEHLGDPAVAIESWRKVLEAVPSDRQALEKLTSLAEESSEWGVFAEVRHNFHVLRM